MRRKECLYAVIGGIVGAVLTMAMGSVLPIGAQNADGTFGEITCTKLNVVDAEGKIGVLLETVLNGGRVSVGGVGGGVMLGVTEYGGTVDVYGKEGSVRAVMGADDEGRGSVRVYGKKGSLRAEMGTEDEGGMVAVWGKDFPEKENFASAVMRIDGEGGLVTVSSPEVPIGVLMRVDHKGGSFSVRDAEKSRAVFLDVQEHGGRVAVLGKDGTSAAKMDITEFGGNVGVFGKGSKESRAGMGVNEYGNGAVSTWDKNGYRLATLGK